MSLTAKVLIAQVVAITVALLTTAGLVNWRAGTAYQGYIYQTQAAQLATLAEQAATQYAAQGDWQAVQTWLNQVAPAMPGRFGMGAGMGRGAMAGRAQGAPAAPALLLVDPQNGRPLGATGAPVSAALLQAGAPVVVDGRAVAQLVALRAPGQMGRLELALLAQVHTAILLSALVAGLLALGIGALLVASILRPLRAVETTVTAVAKGDLAARVAVKGQDEIATLGRAVNQMAVALQAQDLLRQRLVSDVAHELRTPLSVIQGNLQAILDGVYPLSAEEIQTVFGETQLLSRLVTDLHELAQAEAGRLPLQRQSVDAAGVLVHLYDLYAPVAIQNGVHLQVDPVSPDLHVSADPDRLQQILHNLLGNALRHTPSGESIRLAAAPEGACVRFVIQDTGAGIAPGDLPHLFDRFYRADASRALGAPGPADHATGAGLGLAIAKALVQAHGGQVGAYATTPHGATFWFTLPSTAVTQTSARDALRQNSMSGLV